MSLEDIPIRLPRITWVALSIMLITPLIAQAIEGETINVQYDNSIEQNKMNEEEKIVSYIKETFPESPEVAVAVAKAESNLVTNAYGDRENILAPEGSHGIFQINVAVHKDLIGERDITDWRNNVDIAREIYEQAGNSWKPWGAFNNKSYLNHL